MPNRSEIIVSLGAAGRYVATYRGPHRKFIVELFGQDNIPIGWDHTTRRDVVMQAIASTNPGVMVFDADNREAPAIMPKMDASLEDQLEAIRDAMAAG